MQRNNPYRSNPLPANEHVSIQCSHRRWITSLVMALLVVACGDGDTTASVGSGGTGAFSTTAYSEGALTGLGSVTVNGKTYEDQFATVQNEDEKRAVQDLKLGMTIRLTGRVNNNGISSADSIDIDSKIRGPVSQINPIARCFFIFGQRVQINSKTLFDNALTTDIRNIQTGQVLEVHGYLNPVSNSIQATLVELPSRVPKSYKLSGLALNVDSTERTMLIGDEIFDLSAFDVERLPAEGSFTNLTLLPNAPQGTRGWTVSMLYPEYSNSTPQSQADIEGVVTELMSNTVFRLNNTIVDGSNAVLVNGAVKVGDIINVKGALTNGRLIAQEVRQLWPAKAVELNGLISNLSLNTYEPSLNIGDVLVYFDTKTVYESGKKADLANGVNIKVEGVSQPFGSVVRATRITFLPQPEFGISP